MDKTEKNKIPVLIIRITTENQKNNNSKQYNSSGTGDHSNDSNATDFGPGVSWRTQSGSGLGREYLL